MSLGPQMSAAPQFLGPTPPDRVQMTPEDHMGAILAWVRSGQVMPQDFMSLRAFVEALEQQLQMLAGAQAGIPPVPSPQQMNGSSVDAYSSPDATQSPTYAE